ncbi:hypothetical protein D3C72_2030710 [compost metagenome]
MAEHFRHHQVGAQNKRQRQGKGAAHHDAVGHALETFAVLQRAHHAVLDGWRAEQYQTRHGKEKRQQEDDFFRLHDLREAAVEGQDDEEGRQHLRARQEDAQFAEQVG